ncbi:DUF4349 domain-containing protein [Pseudochryseolinea flava]|uniref:DUF4349 domain-containing protein n=1 Tax=Pseudochryseolinea flava TaxID=2059302 RepID=A0A364XX25_9BACT|nr:DUF4349 domain-containing protein [Pseudochryseolinea flava]RAV98753.1 hypothetical protein DQQ10_22310 [Pseudochryseolinea flava]
MNAKLFACFVACIMLVSCGQSMKSEATADVMELEQKTESQQVSINAPIPDIYSNGKKVIKKAHYRFEVNNVKTTTEAIESAARKFGAYIETSQLVLENPILENKITIRVPNESFADLLKEIDQQSVFVNFRNITTDDISKDFVDLESRLKTKREVEQRYMEILRSKAGSIEELLEAEEKIGDLHEEIEATISRLNYLKDQVTYSTLQLEYYQTITQEIAKIENTFWSDSAEALGAGWNGITKVLIALLYLWPLFIVGPIVYFLIRRVTKKTKQQVKSV